jgi:hypothetical protein
MRQVCNMIVKRNGVQEECERPSVHSQPCWCDRCEIDPVHLSIHWCAEHYDRFMMRSDE